MADRVTPTLEQAMAAGFDSVRSGANEKNCHFSFFATETLKGAWEEGRELATGPMGKSKACRIVIEGFTCMDGVDLSNAILNSGLSELVGGTVLITQVQVEGLGPTRRKGKSGG